MSADSDRIYDDWARMLPICPVCKSRAGYSFSIHPRFRDRHSICKNCGAKWYLDVRNEERTVRLEKVPAALKSSLAADFFKEQPLSFWDKIGQKDVERQQQELERKKQELETLEKAGRYEEAAQGYEALGMYEKAGESRRLAKTTYQISTNFRISEDGAISISCPRCGGPYMITESKSNETTCRWCGNQYFIPKKVLDLL
jgi:hypothetical protein